MDAMPVMYIVTDAREVRGVPTAEVWLGGYVVATIAQIVPDNWEATPTSDCPSNLAWALKEAGGATPEDCLQDAFSIGYGGHAEVSPGIMGTVLEHHRPS